MTFYDNPSAACREGKITVEQVDEWLDLVYGPEPSVEKVERAARTINPDGTFQQFQIVGLHRAAKDAHVQQAIRETREPEPTPVPEDLLRDVPEPVYENPLPDLAGEIKRKLGIIAAVRRFGKPQAHIRDDRIEGIKIRCPFPDHEDFKPSAWVNTERNIWACGSCSNTNGRQGGGDVIDFYAARLGFRAPDYHTSGEFQGVVKQMAEELGLSVVKQGDSHVVQREGPEWPSPLPDRPEEEVAPALRDEAPEAEEVETVNPTPVFVTPNGEVMRAVPDDGITVDKMMEGIAFDPGDFADDDEIENELDPAKPIPRLDWRSLPIDKDSFLHEWMQFAGEYLPWVPEEYFLFVGLQAVGLACGNHVTSFTGGPLSGGTMNALIGPSGYGKSTAVSQLRKMLQRVPAAKFNRDVGTGVKVIPSPGSPEALVRSVYTEIDDPSHVVPGTKMEVGVTAWLYEDELATLVEKSRRRGGGAMKTRLIQLSDFVKSRWPDKEIVVEDFSISGGRTALHDCAFSAMFTTQTDSIRAMMDKTDLVSGFLNRIIPVMGVQRVRRTIADVKTPPAVPGFDVSYEALWRWARSKQRVVPFTHDALLLVDSHPFMKHAVDLGNRDSLFARLYHTTVRLAFLLAVNNRETEVTSRYVTAAVEVGAKYLVNCFSQLRSAVISTETDECAERMIAFVKRVHEMTGEWPDTNRWHKDRSYKDFDSVARTKALESLVNEGRLCRIKVTKGSQKQKAFLVPEGAWAGFADADGKMFKHEDLYPADKEVVT